MCRDFHRIEVAMMLTCSSIVTAPSHYLDPHQRDDADRGDVDALTPRRRAFARHYALTGVGSRAAVLAGYAPASASSTACRLLRTPAVRRLVAELQRALTAHDCEQLVRSQSEVPR
jgi:hypothetical protein